MKPFATADARLNRLGIARFRTGHPWIYRAGVDVVEEDTGQEAIARILDPTGRVLGQALLSRTSQITLRILTRSDQPVDAQLFSDRIRSAATRRDRALTGRDAMRLVFGESDGLPGLIVDRYGSHLVLQTLSWGMSELQPVIVEILQDLFKPESILARNDPSVRTLEGLPREMKQLAGETPDIVPVHAGDLVLLADLRRGQKTGTFLDQFENYRRVRELAHGRVLDCFSYLGGFALAAAGAADEVVAVDSSAPAIKQARKIARRNAVDNVTYTEANVFDFLKHADKRRERFDMVILDPPAFAKNKKELESALRGYKEINLRAMKILNPGGILVTCSCSYHLSEVLMEEMLGRAAADAHRVFRIRERREQALDHPVRLGFPESQYLKCYVLEAVDEP